MNKIKQLAKEITTARNIIKDSTFKLETLKTQTNSANLTRFIIANEYYSYKLNPCDPQIKQYIQDDNDEQVILQLIDIKNTEYETLTPIINNINNICMSISLLEEYQDGIIYHLQHNLQILASELREMHNIIEEIILKGDE